MLRGVPCPSCEVDGACFAIVGPVIAGVVAQLGRCGHSTGGWVWDVTVLEGQRESGEIRGAMFESYISS